MGKIKPNILWLVFDYFGLVFNLLITISVININIYYYLISDPSNLLTAHLGLGHFVFRLNIVV